MDNKTIAGALENYAILIDLTGGNPFSAKAYYTAARTIETFPESVEKLTTEDRLVTIKGIGKGIAEKIKEFINTGAIYDYETMKASLPTGLFELLKIPGIGPKKVHTIYEKLNITSLGELEYACLENRLITLDGFGVKTQANILEGIKFVKASQERHLISEAEETAEIILQYIKKIPNIIRAEIGGSIRRRMETIGDIDIVISANSEHFPEIINQISVLPETTEILEKKDSYAKTKLSFGFTLEVSIVKDEEFACALNFITGSKEYITTLKARAQLSETTLNEQALLKNNTLLHISNEKEIYRALGLQYIEPELRENTGEIEAAVENNLPELVKPDDVRGILHIHTQYSDGSNSITELAHKCIEMGYEYVGICDHSVSAFYANGLTEERIHRQYEEIDKLNEELKPFTIFKGIEADILTDGSLDYPDRILKSFDFVIASVHSKLKMTVDEATKRLEKAVQNPFTTILGHPTGRLLLSREGYPVNMEYIIDSCKQCNVIIEINANPHRLDLDWRYCRYAQKRGVKIAICPDAHSLDGLNDMKYGIYTARKGWLTKADIINSLSSAELSTLFAHKRNK